MVGRRLALEAHDAEGAAPRGVDRNEAFGGRRGGVGPAHPEEAQELGRGLGGARVAVGLDRRVGEREERLPADGAPAELDEAVEARLVHLALALVGPARVDAIRQQHGVHPGRDLGHGEQAPHGREAGAPRAQGDAPDGEVRRAAARLDGALGRLHHAFEDVVVRNGLRIGLGADPGVQAHDRRAEAGGLHVALLEAREAVEVEHEIPAVLARLEGRRHVRVEAAVVEAPADAVVEVVRPAEGERPGNGGPGGGRLDLARGEHERAREGRARREGEGHERCARAERGAHRRQV